MKNIHLGFKAGVLTADEYDNCLAYVDQVIRSGWKEIQ
jgi:hypothetical protein